MIMSFIIAQVDFNITNFTSDGILRVAFDPYLSIFGNITWGLIFGFIGAAVYANERSLGTTAVYLIIVGMFMAIIFPNGLATIFGLLLAFIMATILYIAFVQQKM